MRRLLNFCKHLKQQYNGILAMSHRFFLQERCCTLTKRAISKTNPKNFLKERILYWSWDCTKCCNRGHRLYGDPEVQTSGANLPIVSEASRQPIKITNGTVWGRAFQVSGDAALPYLNTRECVLGGYLTKFSLFHPRPEEDRPSDPFPALVYVAMPGNSLWLGDAPLPEIAKQIVSCSGPSGHNVEYLLRLAEFMRESIPEAEDPHLFTLEVLVRSRIQEGNLCLQSLMGEKKPLPERPEVEEPEPEVQPHIRVDSFEFTARVPPKKLRCLNI